MKILIIIGTVLLKENLVRKIKVVIDYSVWHL